MCVCVWDCAAATLASALAGLGFVWGSFGLSKGLISRMLLGGFKVDFELVWVGLGLFLLGMRLVFAVQ